MNTEIFRLQPIEVWENFYRLTQIPRPSKKEKAVIEFVKKFGENLGLETIVDHIGNVIIRKPATPGMENRKGIILQGHLDMVPQKNSDKEFDFEKDSIEAYIDGAWVTANGTTLGADNGIGVASAMGIMASKNIKHGPVEALLTVDEEAGMTGVKELKAGMLNGQILINLDSEDEGQIFIGCAGGRNAMVDMDMGTETEIVIDGAKAFNIKLAGLKGGHSGLDINLGRANAAKVLNSLLIKVFNNADVRIASFNAGDMRNAIPREGNAVVVVPLEKIEKFYNITAETEADLKEKLSNIDPGLQITLSDADTPKTVFSKSATEKLLNAIEECPNGPTAMLTDMPNIVETSTNMSIVRTEGNSLNIKFLMRSSVDEAKDKLANKIKDVFEKASAKVTFDGDYPGWQPDVNSPILQTIKSVYEKKFDKKPEISVIHAGLETALLGGKYPELDMISIGPTIRSPHSPDEKVHIDSVRKYWELLVATLENAPKKENS